MSLVSSFSVNTVCHIECCLDYVARNDYNIALLFDSCNAYATRSGLSAT